MMNQPVTINEQSIEQLFGTWYEPLSYYACSILRDMDEAEETVQRVFCKLWDNRGAIEIRTSVKSYLYRMVHNSCMNRLQQTKTRSGHHQQLAYVSADTVDDTAGKVLYSELEQTVKTAVEALPPQCRKVFELSRYRQLSYLEIANELNISTNTVENHMAKALRLLRENLKDFLPLLIIIIFKSKLS